MKVYLYDKCGTCRKALKWLDLNEFKYTKFPIRDNPPSKNVLKKMLKDRLPDLSVDQALEMLASRGNLIKRPFLISEEVALIGFKEEEWAAALGGQ